MSPIQDNCVKNPVLSAQVGPKTSRFQTSGGGTVYIETYGCQMNEYDSDLIRQILVSDGFQFTDCESEADIVMLNTCSVRENANRRIFQRIQDIRSARSTPVLIGVLGCMATNFRESLLSEAKRHIDFIAGPDSYRVLPTLIRESQRTGQKQFDVTLSEFETYSDIHIDRSSGVNAWIAVMRGCNNFCTFCVVPYTRGRERSRSVGSVVDEVKRVVDSGITQVTLLGQNVNSYQHDGADFTDLMGAVSSVPGIRRVRFTSPHPKDFPRRLLQLIADTPPICKQIHLPLQAGSNTVLKRMNRTYTQGEFLELVAEIRSIIPDVSLSTDVIVGFPDETDDDFADTLTVMRAVQFDTAFMFKYSERPQTVAARRIPDTVPELEKTRRIVELVELQKSISYNKNRDKIGQIQTVMIESLTTKKNTAEMVGRNEGNTIVILEQSPVKLGDYISVKITDASPHALRGHRITGDSE